MHTTKKHASEKHQAPKNSEISMSKSKKFNSRFKGNVKEI